MRHFKTGDLVRLRSAWYKTTHPAWTGVVISSSSSYAIPGAPRRVYTVLRGEKAVEFDSEHLQRADAEAKET